MSKKQVILQTLKQRKLSNHQACVLVKSAHADRIISTIRANPPEGYVLQQEKVTRKIDGENVTYLEFKLIENIC